MKLKKIASLMLAGVMAVSMLAGCSGNTTDNGGASSGDTTPSSSYTETVLKATNAATQTKLSINTNDKLDKAVAWTAQNHKGNGANANTLTVFPANDTAVTAWASRYMVGSQQTYSDVLNGWNFSANNVNQWASKPHTYWTMFYVSRSVSDEFITNEVAEMLDNWAKTMENKGEIVGSYTYDYTVSVSKADCAGADLDTKNDDYVIVGVAVTGNRTENKY
ncbi:hypothetical protein B5G28_05910 [Faecalibacterium sp. An77]|uniref:hypothetical protein n=1 Tax=Faecalibacterium sp. An77 TaxID=1965655 RepID=UPI000B38B7E4|nr:hypothetical protein [Faecalibacterium sp. An77]OUN39364.1 hypothetical protein B5G28_05910 [Faecalibacterium sp. An77]